MQRQKPLQKRSKTRVDQIVKSAELLFASEGVDAVSPSDIAEKAGITRTSLYRYFPNKAAILHAIATTQLEALEALFENVLIADDTYDLTTFIANVFSAQIEFIHHSVSYYAVWQFASTSPELMALQDKKAEVGSQLWKNVLSKIRTDLSEAEIGTIALLLPEILTGMLQLIVKQGVVQENLLESSKKIIYNVIKTHSLKTLDSVTTPSETVEHALPLEITVSA